MDSKTLALLEFPKVLDALGNFAVSEPGREACLALRPLADCDRLASEAELLRQVKDCNSASRIRLSDFPSLDGLFVFLEQRTAILDLDACVALKQVLRQAATLRDGLENELATLRWPSLVQVCCRESWPAKVVSVLKRCVDDDGRLKDQSSPELLSVRQEIRRIHQQCTKKSKDFLQQNNMATYLQEDFVTISSDRYVLPLRTSFKGRIPGIIHDYSQTGETCYFEPLFLVELNNTLQELKKEEREAERRVLMDITQLVRQEHDGVFGAYRTLVEMDTLLAKLGFAEAVDARPIEYAPGLPLRLTRARHPLLALAARGGADKSVVPVDLLLEEGQRGLVISGGNAGGKTVTLKTLGLIALMAASGLPVPAEEGSTLPGWTQIHVFLGDEQSLEDAVSTFTAQIRKLAAIWPHIDQSRAGEVLCILDEFGAGTDPSQGAALAQAVLEGLVEREVHVAAATHFPALKAYALARDNVRAASVLFDPKTKKPLYRLIYDQVGLSLALDVAREHGMPEDILRRAENNMLLDGSDTGSLIEKLNELAAARDKELKKLAEERRKLSEKRVRLEERFELEKRTLMEELKKRSQEIMRDWQVGKAGHKKAMRELAQTRKELSRRMASEREERGTQGIDFDALEKEMSVLYLPWHKSGRVEDKDAKKRLVKVNLAGVSMWVSESELALERKESRPGSVLKPQTAKPAGLRLDLRGLRADEALSELASFLDRALLENVAEVEIVHGRGTGALRREVHQFLGGFPAVRTFTLADEEHGGDGMTQVELK